MPRFTIDGDPVSVAFGHDEALDSVFLHVYDKRLVYDDEASKGVNAVTQSVDQCGGGCYLSLYAGNLGLGTPVDPETLAVYMERFGVAQEQINDLPLRIPKRGMAPNVHEPQASRTSSGQWLRPCAVCCEIGSKCCGKCHSIVYCSETCQKRDWKAHKFFCSLHPFEAKPEAMYGCFRAVLLPEEEVAPRVVHVCKKAFHDKDDGCTYYIPDFEPFLGSGMKGNLRSDYLPERPFAHLDHALHLHFRDAFRHDGSTQNACIAQITGGSPATRMWKGPVLVTKSDRDPDPRYKDIEMQDTHDIVGFIHHIKMEGGPAIADFIRRFSSA